MSFICYSVGFAFGYLDKKIKELKEKRKWL